jgi:hypothetical protein
MTESRLGSGQDALLGVDSLEAPLPFVVDAVHSDRVTLRYIGDASDSLTAFIAGDGAQLQYVDRFGVYASDATILERDSNTIVVGISDSDEGLRRRVYARLRAPLDATCLLLDAEHNEFTPLDAHVVDIGGGGAALAVPAIAPAGATLVCSISVPPGPPIVTITNVLAADADPRDEPDRRHVRVQFTLIAEQDRDRLLRLILDALRGARAS